MHKHIKCLIMKLHYNTIKRANQCSLTINIMYYAVYQALTHPCNRNPIKQCLILVTYHSLSDREYILAVLLTHRQRTVDDETEGVYVSTCDEYFIDI